MKKKLNALTAEKQTLLAEYRSVRNEAQEYEIVEQNVDALLSCCQKEIKPNRGHQL